VSFSYERRFRRFELSYFTRIKFSSGGITIEADAVTKNIGLCGLLLESAVTIPFSTPIEFTIIVQGQRIVEPILLTGSGVVVRVKPGDTLGKFAVAVECRQPISQVEDSAEEIDVDPIQLPVRTEC
jgi:hypothetical protein